MHIVRVLWYTQQQQKQKTTIKIIRIRKIIILYRLTINFTSPSVVWQCCKFNSVMSTAILQGHQSMCWHYNIPA